MARRAEPRSPAKLKYIDRTPLGRSREYRSISLGFVGLDSHNPAQSSSGNLSFSRQSCSSGEYPSTQHCQDPNFTSTYDRSQHCTRRSIAILPSRSLMKPSSTPARTPHASLPHADMSEQDAYYRTYTCICLNLDSAGTPCQ